MPHSLFKTHQNKHELSLLKKSFSKVWGKLVDSAFYYLPNSRVKFLRIIFEEIQTMESTVRDKQTEKLIEGVQSAS